MRNRLEPILKLTCAVLGALLILQSVRVTLRSNPLANVSIPQIPTLSKDTNTLAAVSTNSIGAKGKTNLQATAAPKATGTNVSGSAEVKSATNAVASVPSTAASPSNTLAGAESSPLGSAVVGAALAMASADGNLTVSTQVPASSPTSGIAGASAAAAGGTNAIVLGAQAMEKTGTNLPGTNSVVRLTSPGGTNSAALPAGARPPTTRSGTPMPGMAGSKPLPELSAAAKARIDRIYESELLGQVMRPMPAALIGIAGNMAVLRSSSGQTGLVKEGDSLGEMKLLQIGVNRVLVEEKGEKKELMIFNGYGGESLLSKKETPDETKAK